MYQLIFPSPLLSNPPERLKKTDMASMLPDGLAQDKIGRAWEVRDIVATHSFSQDSREISSNMACLSDIVFN